MKILIVLLIICACGKKTTTQKPQEVPFIVPVETKEEADNFKFTLSLDTPNGVGSMIVLNKKSFQGYVMNNCTWFLIDKNLAVTNSHCLPQEVKAANVECKDFVMGAFKTKIGEEKRYCKKITIFSELSHAIQNDYALIELDQEVSNVDILPFSREGLMNDEVVTIHTITSSVNGNNIQSSYRQHQCVVKTLTSLTNVYSAESSPMAVFQDPDKKYNCRIIPANSGSPVINSKGEIVGLTQSGQAERSIESSDADITSELTQNYGLITNFACLNFNSKKLDEKISPQCSELMKSQLVKNQAISEKSSKKFNSVTREVIRNKLKDLSSSIFFKVSTDVIGNEVIFNFLPQCVKATDQWTQEEIEEIKSIGFVNKRERYTFEAGILIVGFNHFHDYYGQLDVKFLKPRKHPPINYEIEDLRKLKDLKEVKLKSIINGPDRKVTYINKLRICTDLDQEIQKDLHKVED